MVKLPGILLCADWSLAPGRRAVYGALPAARRVLRLAPPAGGWNVERLVEAAAPHGDAIIGVDAPLGLPASYLAAARGPFGLDPGAGFVPWLEAALARPACFEVGGSAAAWSVTRPFFRPPPGKGSLQAFVAAAAQQGVDLWRRGERASGGKSVFTFGLPGQVAPAAQALWRELGAARAAGLPFRIWPFEAALGDGGVKLAEIYPRAAYGVALGEKAPWPSMALAKTQAAVRAAAIDRLRQARWIREAEVALDGLDAALESEDEFDACLAAAALLRLQLAGSPLCGSVDEVAEGGILCTWDPRNDAGTARSGASG